MTIKQQDNSKGQRPGKAGPETGKYGPGFPGNTQRSASQDVEPPDWAGRGTAGGHNVFDPIYGTNAQQPQG